MRWDRETECRGRPFRRSRGLMEKVTCRTERRWEWAATHRSGEDVVREGIASTSRTPEAGGRVTSWLQWSWKER